MRFHFLLISLISGYQLFAQKLENGNFQVIDSSGTFPKGWNSMVAGEPGSYHFLLIKNEKEEPALKIEKAGNGGAGIITQRISFANNQQGVYRFSGSLKTNGVTEGHAYLLLQGFDEKGLRVIRTIKEKSFLTGNTGWQNFSFEVFLPSITSYLIAGGALEGNGAAWIRDLKLEKLSKPVHQKKVAKNYITEVMDTICRRFLYKDRVDTNRIRSIAYAMTANARTTRDCYDAIWAALFNLGGDRHSSFMTPEEARDYSTNEKESVITLPTGKLIDGRIGYIKVPQFYSVNQALMKKYVDSMTTLIRMEDRPGLTGWVVDIRDNTGGSNIPMLAGIAPVAGEGWLMGYTDNKGRVSGEYYKQGALYADPDTLLYKNHNPYTLIQKDPYVAVLFNGRCGSSGESVVVSFLNRPKTKTFGEPTAGFTTGNGMIRLRDGAVLTLTEGISTDRKGMIHEGKIKPDALIQDNPSTHEDEVLTAALTWLKEITENKKEATH